MTVARRVLVGILAAAVVACDVSVSEEDELGDQYAAAIRSQLPILEDSAASAWLTQLGTRLTSVADSENRDWHFYLVDDSTVNAFAVPELRPVSTSRYCPGAAWTTDADTGEFACALIASANWRTVIEPVSADGGI